MPALFEYGAERVLICDELAVVGDISEHVERSNALREWVVECNRRNDLWFVATVEKLPVRLVSP